jgi:6-phosphogluconolactonase
LRKRGSNQPPSQYNSISYGRPLTENKKSTFAEFPLNLISTYRWPLREHCEDLFSMQQKLIAFVFLCFIGPLCTAKAAPKRSFFVYIGTYTGAKSEGIYLSRFDSETGSLSFPQLAAKISNPSFLAAAPGGKFLYAVAEVERFKGKPTGSVAAFRVQEKSGKLDLINEQPSNGGAPCHIAVDSKGKCALTANYGSGTVSVLPIRQDGSLGEPGTTIQDQGSSVNRDRQSGPHAHFITADPGNHFALACDLGLDEVLVYRLDPIRATLRPNDPPSVSITPGAGPRHLAFHPNGRFVYVISELNSTMTACSYDSKKGVLKVLQNVSTLPPEFKGTSYCSEVQVHRSGKFVYGSNRGHNSLAVFAIDSRTGLLTNIGYESVQGKTPRHFAIDPTGKWLLAENQDSSNIVVFRIDPKTGKIESSGKTVEVGSPVCAVFVPTF